MKDYDQVYDVIRKSHTVNAVARLIAEFNHNRYSDPTAKNTPAAGENDANPDIYDIDSIVEGRRPGRGIIKARVGKAKVSADYETVPVTPRYYVSSETDIYKYWSSPQPSETTDFAAGTGLYPTDVNPEVTYGKPCITNKIVIGLENSFSDPDEWEIWVKDTSASSWRKIKSTTDIYETDDEGRVSLWWDGTNWTQTKNLDYHTTLAGVQLRVQSMTVSETYFNLIELGLRLEKDVTSYLQKVDDLFDLGEATDLRPIGSANSNVASVTLFNHYDDGFIWNDENENSIFRNMMEENVKFTLDYLYTVAPDTFIPVRQFEMYSTKHWSAQSQPATEVSLRDSSKFLQETKSQALFYENKTVTGIIYRVLDSVGFDNYDIGKLGKQMIDGVWLDIKADLNPMTVPYFWSDPNATVWDTLQSLCEGTQTAMWFDAYDRLQVRTRNQVFNEQTGKVWTLRGNTVDDELVDIVDYDTNDNEPSNDVTVNYQTTAFEEYLPGIRRNTIVWQPEDETVYVKSSDIQQDIPSDSSDPNYNLIKFTPADAALWPFEGMMRIEAEQFAYKGKQYTYYPVPNSYSDVASPVTFKVASYNFNGGYHGDWALRVPLIAQDIVDVNPDILLIQEAHEAAGEHTQVLDAVHALGATNYVLVVGSGGNHFMIKSNVFVAKAPPTRWKMPHNRDASTVTFVHISTGMELNMWNTHLIAGNPAYRSDQIKYLSPILNNMGARIGGGDLNNETAYSGSPLQLLEANGDIEIRSLVGSVTNGTMNSYDGYLPNEMESTWLDHLFVSNGPTVDAVGLYDTGNASDHNMIWTDVRCGSRPTLITGNPETVWLESYDDYKKYHFDLTPVANRYLNKYTGYLKVTERGMWNTPIQHHEVETLTQYDQKNARSGVAFTDVNGVIYNERKLATYKSSMDSAKKAYDKKKSSSNKKKYQSATAAYESYAALYAKYKNAAISDGIDTASQKGTIQFQTTNNYEPDRFLMAMTGTTGDLGYKYYGTRLRFNTDSVLNIQDAGLMFQCGGDAGEAGYRVELCKSGGTGGAGRVRLFRQDATGKQIGIKTVPQVVLEDTWYSLDVNVTGDDSTSNYQIAVFVNGILVVEATVTGTQKLPYYGRFGLFARSKTNVEFEYLYAIGQYDYSAGWPTNFPKYDRFTKGFRSAQFDDFVSNKVDKVVLRKNVKKQLESFPVKYTQLFFDEFGPIAHEIRKFDAKYDTAGLPVLAPYTYWTNTGNVDILDSIPTSFGNTVYMLNTARDDSALKGTDDNHQFCIYGLALKQRDVQTITSQDKKSIASIGSKELNVESKWIQTKEAAQSLADWITAHWSKATDSLNVNAFGNCLIEVGDVVALDIEIANIDETTHKYFVTSARNEFSDGGLTTQLTLRRIRN